MIISGEGGQFSQSFSQQYVLQTFKRNFAFNKSGLMVPLLPYFQCMCGDGQSKHLLVRKKVHHMMLIMIEPVPASFDPTISEEENDLL